MITIVIAVATDGAAIISPGTTFGIPVALLFSHGMVCSAATGVLARLNLFYDIINGNFSCPIPLCNL